MSVIAAALKPRSVLMATDFSEASEKALCHALAIARFYDSKFCLAHVVSSLGLTMAGDSAISACEDAVSRDTSELKESLLRTGALAGIQHNFIVRHGDLWPELRQIMRDEASDLLVLGAHGRHGLRKLFFGSVVETILRQADCPVVTFGPRSDKRPWVGTSRHRTFLFVADWAHGSKNVLPHAIALANHFEAKLAFLNIVPNPTLPQCNCWHNAVDIKTLRQDALMKAREQMRELANDAILEVPPEFHAEFASVKSAGESIAEAAEKLGAHLIIMGVQHSAHSELASHFVSSTAYEVVCRANAPILTVKCSGELTIRPRAPRAMSLSLSEADTIRLRGLGAKW